MTQENKQHQNSNNGYSSKASEINNSQTKGTNSINPKELENKIGQTKVTFDPYNAKCSGVENNKNGLGI